jgi:hypothetical protein
MGNNQSSRENTIMESQLLIGFENVFNIIEVETLDSLLRQFRATSSVSSSCFCDNCQR